MKKKLLTMALLIVTQITLCFASDKTVNELAITSIHATIECSKSENNSVYFPLDEDCISNNSRKYIYYTELSLDTVSIIVENKEKGILIDADGNESPFYIEWDSEVVSSITTKDGVKYFMLYDANWKLVQIAKEKPFVLKALKGQVEKKFKEFWTIDIIDDKLNKVDRRLKPLDINGGSYYKSQKTVSYGADLIKISLTSYKTGKQRKPKNITNSMLTTINLIKPCTIKTEQTSGDFNEVRFVEMNTLNNKMRVTKTQSDRVSVTNYIYENDKLHEENTKTKLKGKFLEQIKLSYEYDNPTNTKKVIKRKFNKEGECIFEDNGAFKYREKIDGVWSDWKNYQY